MASLSHADSCDSAFELQAGLAMLQGLVFELRRDLDDLRFHMEILDGKATQFLQLLSAMQDVFHPSAGEAHATEVEPPVLAPAPPHGTSRMLHQSRRRMRHQSRRNQHLSRTRRSTPPPWTCGHTTTLPLDLHMCLFYFARLEGRITVVLPHRRYSDNLSVSITVKLVTLRGLQFSVICQ
jgi:hypothetical protein